MKIWPLLLVCLVALTSAATAANPPKPNTLRGNVEFPSQDIERSADPEVWCKISDLEYTAYTALEGRIDGSGKVRIQRTLKNFPDATREQQATDLGNTLLLLKGFVGSSRVPPRARVWVLFYENLPGGGRLALIVAKQVEASTKGKDFNVYLKPVAY